MVLTIIGALFPVFGLIALGYCCERRMVIGENAGGMLNRFVGQLTLPVLTFHTLATMEPANLAMPEMVLAIVGGAYAVYFLTFAGERISGVSVQESNIVALGSCYSNSAFVGLPVCYVLLGKESLGPSTVVIALQTAFVFSGAVMVSVLAEGGKRTMGAGLSIIVRQLSTNPLIIGASTGVAFAMTGLALPEPLDATLKTLGGATGPCALISIGMFVARPLAQFEVPSVLRSLGFKLLLHPMITIGLLAMLPALPAVWRGTVILMAAMPTASSTFILAAKQGESSGQIAVATIVLTTVAAAITLPALLALLDTAGLIRIASGQ